MGDHAEAFAGMLHHLSVDFMGTLQAPAPSAQPCRAVPPSGVHAVAVGEEIHQYGSGISAAGQQII